MKLLLVSSFTLIIASLLGCGLGMPDRSVYRIVEPAELVGTWELRPASIRHLVADGYIDDGQNCTITFHADGAAEFSSVNTIPSPPEHQIRVGFWKIAPCSVNGDTRVTISRQKPSRHGFASFGFTEHYGPLRLWNFLGDPDMWEFVEYTKVE